MGDFGLQDMGGLKIIEFGPTTAETESGRLAHETLFCVEVCLLLRVGKCVPRSSPREVNSYLPASPPQLHLGSLITIRAELLARHKREHLLALG